MNCSHIKKCLLFVISYVIALCHAKTALLVIDVQNCFVPCGSLAVENGDEVIPVINSIRNLFDFVVVTQDWHCPEHVSFASQHPG